ncbi:MAG: CHAT domain-containing protein [Bacteroidota bacterium]
MSKPIVYVAFANQQDNHLPLLKKEGQHIKNALRPLEQREFIKLEIDESVELSDMLKTLAAYPDQLAIFHYAGHAESTELQLEGGSAQSKGLAQLLGEQQALQLVFLNGCSTKGQVQQLFDAGVPAVIATSVPIEDPKAVEFSAAFYQALANKRSIKTAFEFAKASLEAAYRSTPEMTITRGIKLKASPTTPDTLPWALYLKEDKATEALQWRLPYYREIGLPKDMVQYIGKELKLNRYIVMVLDAMARYNKDIYHQMVTVKEGREVKRDSSAFLDLVIRNFPWVIGSQIQLLRQKQQANQARLEQLLSTYLITSKVLYFILLSNFWEQSRKQQVNFSKSSMVAFGLEKGQVLTTNFLERVLQLFQLFQSYELMLFAPEYEAFCEQLQANGHLAKAWNYLETLKQQLVNNKLPAAIETECLKTEQAVAILLQQTAWLADYKMLTVRNISIDNPRFGQKLYEHKLGPLNAIVNTSLSLYDDAANRLKENYANCKSIVLARSEADLSTALNLSPFIIDKNTFLNNDHIDLFIYGYSENGVHAYLAIKHSIFVALKNEKGTDIIDTSMTLEDFQEGRNINRQVEQEDDFGFGAAFGFEETTTATSASPSVFEILSYQFEQLQTDLPNR